MTAIERRIFSLVKKHPDKPGHFFQGKMPDVDPTQVVNTIERLEEKGLIRKTFDNWESYTANSWQDIPIEEQVDHALAYITQKHTGSQNWSTDASELSETFNDELDLNDLNSVCDFLIENGMVHDCSTKDGVCVGAIPATHKAYKQKTHFNSSSNFNYTDQRMNNTLNNYGHIHGDISQVNQTADIDFDLLIKELTLLRQTMQKEATDATHTTALGEIAAAEIAAKKKDGPSALLHLKKAGAWALGQAVQIGARYLIEKYQP